MTRTTIRLPCPMCASHGEIVNEEMPTGWSVCPECMGHGWKDETPQPHGEPHPDPQPAPLP